MCTWVPRNCAIARAQPTPALLKLTGIVESVSRSEVKLSSVVEQRGSEKFSNTPGRSGLGKVEASLCSIFTEKAAAY
jgi:hypothetical protein